MSGRRSRRKGAEGERSAARALSDVLGVPARRGQQYSGVEGKDVVLGIPGIHVEDKRTEKLSLYPAMQQAIRDARPDEVPIVLHRRNGKQWLAVLNLTDLMRLARVLTGASQSNELNGEDE